VELEGLTQVAAARRLRVPLSSLKSRVQRGRHTLRRMLTDCCRIALDARGGVTEFTQRTGAPCKPNCD
jgi:RNA polymerase sigma-70 factor (ECF subfamily)